MVIVLAIRHSRSRLSGVNQSRAEGRPEGQIYRRAALTLRLLRQQRSKRNSLLTAVQHRHWCFTLSYAMPQALSIYEVVPVIQLNDFGHISEGFFIGR